MVRSDVASTSTVGSCGSQLGRYVKLSGSFLLSLINQNQSINLNLIYPSLMNQKVISGQGVRAVFNIQIFTCEYDSRRRSLPLLFGSVARYLGALLPVVFRNTVVRHLT
jgi:hypothetical protein